MKLKTIVIATVLFCLFACADAVSAQTEFTYQGSLKDGANPANGSYDFQFKLFNTPTSCCESAIQTRNAVQVTNGTFTVRLNFGFFVLTDRFIEIGVRPSGGGTYTILAPREEILPTPYSMKSGTADTAGNASLLNGVPANQYVLTTDARMTDARNPLANSTNYVQNRNTPQTGTNFNISGSGTVGGTLSANQFDLNGARVLGVGGTDNLFVGVGAGNTGAQGTFVGKNAGTSNTGHNNSVFGASAGSANLSGAGNSFFGSSAGANTSDGNSNSFFGNSAGRLNAGGSINSFFGSFAGEETTSGLRNTFLGGSAGRNNSFGSDNTFVGQSAASQNTTGTKNTVLGFDAEVSGNVQITNGTAIGAESYVSASNSLVLGSINGINGATASTNVGIGTSSPDDRLHVVGMIRVSTLGAAGAAHLCHNTSFQIASCSSSLRYKSNLNGFNSGLDLVRRFKPITFDWKDGGIRDVGLGAEDVAAIEPLLVTYNDKGQVEGVKYDRIGVVLVNAVKEQQTQIEAQRKEIELLRNELQTMRELLCASKGVTCPPK